MGNNAMAFADTDVVDAQDIEYTGGKNGESSALAIGTVVCLDLTAADGITFKLPSATNAGMVLGVLAEAVAAGAYTSKIVKRGVTNVLVLGHADSLAGGELKAVAGQAYATHSVAAPAINSYLPWCTILVTYVTTSAALKSCYVRVA